jgi:O-antigen biosynthesis protein
MNNETSVFPQKANGDRQPAIQEQPLSHQPATGLASILIPCCGQLEFTKLLVPSLIRNTRQPYELIFIDVGSLDGTAEYLAGLTAGTQIRTEVVRTATDIGIPQAVQDAFKLCRGEYIVLLNNDCIVTDSWLNQLVSLAQLSPAVGLVGPMSNYAAPPQLVEGVPYRIGPKHRGQGTGDGSRGQGTGVRGQKEGDWVVDTSQIDAFAQKWREDHKGKWIEVERLGGFCLLVKRQVLKAIGHLHDPWDLDIFDTDLLSAKARQGGFTLACCKDLFVHHFGTRTFAHGAPNRGEGSGDRGEVEAATTPAGLPGR